MSSTVSFRMENEGLVGHVLLMAKKQASVPAVGETVFLSSPDRTEGYFTVVAVIRSYFEDVRFDENAYTGINVMVVPCADPYEAVLKTDLTDLSDEMPHLASEDLRKIADYMKRRVPDASVDGTVVRHQSLSEEVRQRILGYIDRIEEEVSK